MKNLAPVSEIKAIRRQIAIAIQDVYEAWDHGDGGEPRSGRLALSVAWRMRNILVKMGVQAAVSEEGDRIFVVARSESGIYRLDIPIHVYETASGHVWRKTEGVTFAPGDIQIEQLSSNPNEWTQFSGEELGPDDWYVRPEDRYTAATKVELEDSQPMITWAPIPSQEPPRVFKSVGPIEPPKWLQAKSMDDPNPTVVMVTDVPSPPPSPPSVSPIPPMSWTGSIEAKSAPSSMVTVTDVPPPPTRMRPEPPYPPRGWEGPTTTERTPSSVYNVKSVPEPPAGQLPPEAVIVSSQRSRRWTAAHMYNSPPPQVHSVRTVPEIPKESAPQTHVPPAPPPVDIMKAGPVTVVKGIY